jgi:thioredoxin-related protein
MKKLFGLLLLTSSLFSKELTWNHHMAEAIKLSQDSNKPIMMMYSATWCGECDKMKNKIFQTDGINKLLRDDFILLSFDVEQDMERLPEGFSFRGVPTFFFINSDKKLLKKVEGSCTKDSFLGKLKAVK